MEKAFVSKHPIYNTRGGQRVEEDNDSDVDGVACVVAQRKVLSNAKLRNYLEIFSKITDFSTFFHFKMTNT